MNKKEVRCRSCGGKAIPISNRVLNPKDDSLLICTLYTRVLLSDGTPKNLTWEEKHKQ